MNKRKQIDETYEERIERLNRTFDEVQKNIYRQEVTFNTENYVVMANAMIRGGTNDLSLLEVLVLRFFIMQTKKGDKELLQFSVSVSDLAKALEMNEHSLYNKLKSITEHLMREVIIIDTKDNKHWKQFHWVDVCEYENGILNVKISDELRPFLVGLRGSFTRYRLSEIIKVRSVYAIRIFEDILSYLDENHLPHANAVTEISISIEELRRITNTTDKYTRYSAFKAKVMDIAIREINENTRFHITATPYKRQGKAIAGYDFLIESVAGYIQRTKGGKAKKIDIVTDYEPENRQLELSDFALGDDYRPITIKKG